MRYRVVIPPAIVRQIATLNPLLKRQIRSALDDLAEDPWQGKVLRQELLGLYSYRVRRYRIVYIIHNEAVEVHVLAIGPRRDIYRGLA